MPCSMTLLWADGFCSNGFYAGWVAVEASEEVCMNLCLSEPTCRFVALAVGLSCSRYDDRAGDCVMQPDPEHRHVVWKKICDATDGSDAVPTASPLGGDAVIQLQQND